MLCVQGDCSVVEKKVAHCQLMRLKLFDVETVLLPVLSGVKDNHSITDLVVRGEPITTCFYNYTMPHMVFACIGWAHTCMHILWKHCPSPCHPYTLKVCFGCVYSVYVVLHIWGARSVVAL